MERRERVGNRCRCDPGAFPVAGFEGGLSTMSFFVTVCIAMILLPTDHSQKGMPTLAKRHFPLRISGMPL